MDSPPMFDISRLDIWKVNMSCYLKTLGLHVHLAITRESYLSNSKHIKANAIALKENEFLKSKNDCDDVLKNNKVYLQN